MQNLNDLVPNGVTDAQRSLEKLIAIMAALRHPLSGCPWDKEQSFESIAPYTIEEAYEVADAIDRHDMADLKDELGDLLLQVVYHARIAEEQGLFSFSDVAESINAKLIRRHPHVFGDGEAEGHRERWEDIKKQERMEKAAKNGAAPDASLFDGVPAGLPALLRSEKLQRRAARIGFDWPSLPPLVAKVEEELAELKVEIDAPEDDMRAQRRFEEFGDLMFILVNLGLHLDLNAEASLRAANAKFMRRIVSMERSAATLGKPLQDMTLDEMNALWDEAKIDERGKS